MPCHRTRSVPKYALHRATGQARVRIDGVDHYLGEFGSEQSRTRYEALISAWLARQAGSPGLILTLDELALQYLHFVDQM